MVQESGVREQGVPWQAWFSIGILAIAAVFQIPAHLSAGHGAGALAVLVVSIALAYGLYRRHRWAFIVYVLFCATNALTTLSNPVVVLVNLALGSVLLTAYPRFFRQYN